MSNQFFITRADMQALTSLLREIPSLVEDLAITLTRQDKTARCGARIGTHSDVQPLPMNLAASEAHELLNSTLTAWARHACESRAQVYTGSAATTGVARWLADHVTSLAMTEGCEEAHDEIEYAMRECRRACDFTNDRSVRHIDPNLIPELEALELTSAQCARTASDAGIPLSKRRVAYLGETRKGRIRKNNNGDWLYRFGDILDANGTPLRHDLGREQYVVG
ncbi:hypothetical protein [Rhodococcus xishaensis]|uniref:Uncharacterized protein n=1 Tax=Rhodococcus xishaensis TaxID=2487364 RepID=A0A3S3B4K0_9NOCA|nr:hypothetical protein [Rhodococcus xishaensis]RVW03021.1 hypothetical protein EGT50_09945 [Rhodococcus xishaensis]